MAEEKDNQSPDAGAAPAATPQKMWVKSTLPPKEDGGNQVVLWEKDPAHPKGEVIIAGPKPVEVGVTPAVSQLLRDGKIVEASALAKAGQPAAAKNGPAK